MNQPWLDELDRNRGRNTDTRSSEERLRDRLASGAVKPEAKDDDQRLYDAWDARARAAASVGD